MICQQCLYNTNSIKIQSIDFYVLWWWKDIMMYVLQGLLRDTLIEDDKGKRMEAMKVFSAAIGYLRNHLLSTCKKQLKSIEDSDIKWVLTVPAIWTDSSKQFMREAAEKVRFLCNIFELVFTLCHKCNRYNCLPWKMLNHAGNSYITRRKQLCHPPDTVMSHR